MNRENNRRRGDKLAGIRLNRMNILMICIGLIIATLMAVSMYRTTVSVKEIVTVTNNYLSNQSAGGMLRDFATNLGDQAMAFVQSGVDAEQHPGQFVSGGRVVVEQLLVMLDQALILQPITNRQI